ncbi:actin cortical patch SUR7/pH-response regulator pali [Spinellus fusiger]|nr:actin cortical patch SUR7/pH-response regulator pali [Spinellus fusiger]
MGLSAHIATISLGVVFILQLFLFIGSTYNKPLLKDIYFFRFTLGKIFYSFGLWSYCNGSGDVTFQCSHPVGGFIWTTANGVGILVASLRKYDNLFVLNFASYWIAFLINFISISMLVIRRFQPLPSLLLIGSTFLSFFFMLLSLILTILLSLRGLSTAREISKNVHGEFSSATWVALMCVLCLFYSTSWHITKYLLGHTRRVRDDEIDDEKSIEKN